MTQQQLADAACVALGTIRKIERGERGVTDATLEAIADALGVDPGRLRADRTPVHTRVHAALPALSAALATYDCPDEGPVRPLRELRAAVAEAARWRLAAAYTRIARELPDLLKNDLVARRQHAIARGWKGEVEGIELTLTFLRSKRAQVHRSQQLPPLDLGIPFVPHSRRTTE
ncbi:MULTISPECIES: helix-turn-helix transcriptional regulator [unclassified Streptomyces]|uniref:helix-turn-helix domain-containing protein n=1 Tax=unclassified Streptomyces TaxID=2593676 RepID=UPI0033A7E253